MGGHELAGVAEDPFGSGKLGQGEDCCQEDDGRSHGGDLVAGIGPTDGSDEAQQQNSRHRGRCLRQTVRTDEGEDHNVTAECYQKAVTVGGEKCWRRLARSTVT